MGKEKQRQTLRFTDIRRHARGPCVILNKQTMKIDAEKKKKYEIKEQDILDLSCVA